MNQEMPLRYRIWIPTLEEMRYVHKENYLAQSGILDQLVDCDKGIWLLSTGREDRDGKEVFAGDIVGFINDLGTISPTSRKIVKWAENLHHIGFNIGSKPKAGRDDRMKVLGNIYQNPDLARELR